MDAKELEIALATVHDLLVAERMNEAAELVRLYPASSKQTDYDNWNGGIGIWEVCIEIPPTEYAKIGSEKSRLEQEISDRLGTVIENDTADIYGIKIIPAKSEANHWRSRRSDISQQIRTTIFDGLKLEQVTWNGALNEVEFLNRIFDLKSLPSYDHRFEDASGDIWQHCINNEDWDRGWVFSDRRFNLLEVPAETFLKFLCEMVNPVVRPDRDEAFQLVKHFNDQLRLAGWEMYEGERVAGRPRFFYRLVMHGATSLVRRARTVVDALDAGAMAKAIDRMEKAIESDPELAIGTAKELVESCCKTILTKREVPFGKSDDLGDLTKKVAKALRLVPQGITDEAKGAENIRRILQNLTQMTNNLAQLRGLYGTGHGRDGQHRGLQPRHARLAVASAVAFIDFATETYQHRESGNSCT